MTVAGPLEEERDFLLRSLDDLERERAAGDVDEHDYQALKDDYTARAAAVLRAIDAGRDATPAAQRRPRARAVLLVVAVVAFASVAGVLLAHSMGRRDAGEVVTGGIRQSITEKLNEAGRLSGTGNLAAALDLYDEVLADDPDNAEALTYKGWVQTLDGDRAAGLSTLLDAATRHPTYPDVHAFLAVVFFRNGLVEPASRELARLDALDPPAAIRDLIGSLRAQIEAAQATSTTAPTPAAGAGP